MNKYLWSSIEEEQAELLAAKTWLQQEEIREEISQAREWLALNQDLPELVRYYQRIIRNGERALAELEGR